MIEPTAYQKVKKGFWWARYETQNWSEKNVRQVKDWMLVEVAGMPPFLEVYQAPRDGRDEALQKYKEEWNRGGSDVVIEWAIVFYNRVKGPPKEDG